MLVARGSRTHIIMSVPQGMEFVNNPCQIKYVDGILVSADATLFGGLLTGHIFLAPILDVMRIAGVRGVLAVFPAVEGHRVGQMTAGQPRRGTAIPSRAVHRLTAGGVPGVPVRCHVTEGRKPELVPTLHQMSAAQLAAEKGCRSGTESGAVVEPAGEERRGRTPARLRQGAQTLGSDRHRGTGRGPDRVTRQPAGGPGRAA